MSNSKAELPDALPVPGETALLLRTLQAAANRLVQFWPLTKPRVTQMTVFCALIGSLLASGSSPDWPLLAWTAVGIWLLAGAAFAVNCLIEAAVDAHMTRTARRASASGELTRTQTVLLAAAMGTAGAALLYSRVNALTMWLTIATFVGYALIYTVLLKPNTSQNIVIGGLARAMPPALGGRRRPTRCRCRPGCWC